MGNPWKSIKLSDYESHMKLDTVMQLQILKPQYVSCGIQINSDDDFVSDSPYLHTFDDLSNIHHDIEAKKLSESMGRIGYECILKFSSLSFIFKKIYGIFISISIILTSKSSLNSKINNCSKTKFI